MTLSRLSLRSFRCYDRAEFAFVPGVNVIKGSNGAGKTTVIEAVGYLSTARSFRKAPESELIRFGQQESRVEAQAEVSGRSRHIEITLGTRRVIKAESEVLTSPRQLLGILPSVLFSPEDITLVRGGPAERRRFTDITLGQLSPRYVTQLSRYKRLLRDKAKLLGAVAEKPSFLDMLPEINAQLARIGAYISGERAGLASTLARLAGEHHAAVSGGRETLSLNLKSHALDERETLSHLERRVNAEIASRQCLVGSHKDELELFLNGKPLREYASQGQARTASLALKLAQRDIFTKAFGEPPPLLLDDVLSELDNARRAYILGSAGGGQVIITCCDEAIEAENVVTI
ncbi:MAG: DNA replication/repair protein RecF [Oscillospiraceae bacterium]|jgi:DNA replication and repair protein RecF|nr:DNA replication/repair protein RecF [Oscillospiraceae bacterium]